MSVYVESNIELDFTMAHDAKGYETLLLGRPGATSTTRNTFWPGVDVLVEDRPGDFIWLEVKSWNPQAIPPKDRGGSRWSFQCKMKSNAFATEMRGKFLGTASFHVWDGLPWPGNVNFVMLFEPPHPLDDALILGFSHRVKQQIMPPKILPWRNRITISALPLREWNRRFPDYPAILI